MFGNGFIRRRKNKHFFSSHLTRFGRKTVLVYSTLMSSSVKILKSFATNYNVFVTLEAFDAGLSSPIYPAAMIMGMEMATSDQKILVSCLILIPYALGQVATAFIASYVQNYKWLLRVISMFGIATIPYIWILSESLRWLLVNKKHEKAVNLLANAAKMNGLNVSSKSYDIIRMECTNGNAMNKVENHGAFMDILCNCTLLTRFVICAFCWISSAFITYGVSIISVSLQGDKYVNFMVVSFSGIPGVLLTYVMLTYLRRRWSMCVSLMATGLSILASKYFSWNATLSLIFFFLGKLFINHSFTALYIFTTEMWPTVLRHSVMGTCSMIGRFGSIAAPLVPLLVKIYTRKYLLLLCCRRQILSPFYLFHCRYL